MKTPAEIQAQLDATNLAAKVEKVVHAAAPYDNIYVTGGIGYAGRSLWVTTTAADTASTQAAAITTAMRAYR